MRKLTDFLIDYKYVPKEYEKNILTFNYKGIDRSYLYKYIFSPIAEFCLKFTPLWIAPNTLTIISFLHVLIPHIFFMIIFGTRFEGPVPDWLTLLTSVTYFIYMNLDNMDGKQARRTGNTSPLGTLLDHQMDSMVVICEGINVSTTVQYGPTVYAFLIFGIPAFQFYLNTMEAYYTGMMDLPIINGASEGALSVGLFLFLAWLWGPNYLDGNIPLFNMQWKYFMQQLFIFISIFTGGLCIYNIYNHNKNLLSKCIKSTFYGAFLIIGTGYLMHSSGVSETHGKQIFYLGGFVFSSQCGIMQLYHVAHIPLPIFRAPGLILIGLPLLNTIYFQLTSLYVVDQGLLINLFAVIAFLMQSHFLFNMSKQMKSLLKINIFSINKRSH